MNVLLIDVYSCFLDFAIRCQDYVHTVRWFQSKTKENLASTVGNGIVPCVPHWEPHMRWADIIIVSDNVKYITLLERYRREGYPIFGPNQEVTDWELDRIKGHCVLENANIKCMESIPFSNYDKAAEFVKKEMKRYVSKPNAEDNKALSYVSKGPADLVFMLDYWKKNSKLKPDFILQEFKSGIEVAVGGWFGKGGWSSYFCENFEHKKLMNDDVGVNTGEMGTVLKYTQTSELANQLLRPLEGELYRQGYTGYLDVSVIVGKDGTPYPLEFTSRPGWPLFQIQSSVHKGDPVQWMCDLMCGQDTFIPSEEVATGIVMALPDFPYSRLTKKEVSGYPIYGWEKIQERNFHPAECMCGKMPIEKDGKVVYEENLVTAGDYVCVISGNGSTVTESIDRAYKNLKKIEIPNSPMYRTDIGCRVKEQLPKLQEQGFCESWKL
jgi:phosphoribosylamine--glycine ligase